MGGDAAAGITEVKATLWMAQTDKQTDQQMNRLQHCFTAPP